MKQTERIQMMEEKMNSLKKAIGKMSKALEEYSEAQKDAEILNEYLGSDDWWKDVKADVDKKLPADLKRGVLSEDGIYNLLDDNSELLDELKEFLEKIKE